jgi:hypothetical protein
MFGIMYLGREGFCMIGREYLSRQALTLLRLARLTTNPNVAANLTTKAADMQSRVEEAPLSPELPPTAPEIQSER